MTYLINRNYTTKSFNRLTTPDRKPYNKDGSTGDLNTHKGSYYVMVRIVCPFVRPPVCLFVLKCVPIQNGCIIFKDLSSISHTSPAHADTMSCTLCQVHSSNFNVTLQWVRCYLFEQQLVASKTLATKSYQSVLFMALTQ